MELTGVLRYDSVKRGEACMDGKKVLIIGGVAAGMKAAAKVRRDDQTAIITVVEKGDLVSYGACGMPYVVGKEIESIEHLMMTPSGKLRDPEFFKNRKNIDVKVRTEIGRAHV